VSTNISQKRRDVLRKVGTATIVGGTGLLTTVPTAAAKRARPSQSGPPTCPDCPEGTTFFAKYEFQGDRFVPEHDKTTDPVEIHWTSKDGEKNEPIKICWRSDVPVHSVIIKAGRNCKWFGSEHISVTHMGGKCYQCVDLRDHGIKNAISFVSFCGGCQPKPKPVCYQVDFAYGEPIEELAPDNLYGERLIANLWGGTEDPINEGASRLSPLQSRDDCMVDFDANDWRIENGTLSLEVDVTAKHECTLSLVSYRAPCPPEFDPETIDQQVLVDYDTKTVSGQQTVTFAVALPDQMDY
jgi:hypothetical protein